MKWIIGTLLLLAACGEPNTQQMDYKKRFQDSLRYSNMMNISGTYTYDKFSDFKNPAHDTKIREYNINICVYDLGERILGYYKIYDMNTWNQENVTGRLYLTYDTIKINDNSRWIKRYVSDTTARYGTFSILEFNADVGIKMPHKDIRILGNSKNPKQASLYGDYDKLPCLHTPYKIIEKDIEK